MRRLVISVLRAILRKLDPPQADRPLTPREVGQVKEIAAELREIGGHALCTAEHCSLKYHHSPCRYQTALAAKFAAELDKPAAKVRKKATGKPALKAKKRVRG